MEAWKAITAAMAIASVVGTGSFYVGKVVAGDGATEKDVRALEAAVQDLKQSDAECRERVNDLRNRVWRLEFRVDDTPKESRPR